MSDILTADVCIIGAGAGGTMAAFGSAALGAKTILVEAGRMGGQRVHAGCIPWAAFRAAARRQQGAPDWARVYEAVEAATAAAARNDSVERLGAMGVTVVQNTARFVTPEAVAAGPATIRARRFILATGSRPVVPTIPGLDTVRALTIDAVVGAGIRPDHLLILGADPRGVEIAQAYAGLGVRVTIVAETALLADLDPEIAAAVLRGFARDGIVVHAPAVVQAAEPSPDGVRLLLSGPGGDCVEQASHLILACGRAPVLAGLGLDVAGVQTADGRLVLRRDGRTTNRRVYAVGDVTSPKWPTTAYAQAQARIALRSALFHAGGRFRPETIPSVLHTHPPAARAGLDERQVRKACVLRWSFADTDAGLATGERVGHVKLVADPRGTLVGASIFGPRADELIAVCHLAISRKMTVRDLAALSLPSPTFADGIVRAASVAVTPRLRSPWVRRWLTLAKRLG